MIRSHPERTSAEREREAPGADAAPAAERWRAPRYEVIALACEITAYAPDDTPLF